MPYCPDCHNELEAIKACGCNDYFCNHCNQLVSKKRMLTEQPKTQAQAAGPEAVISVQSA